MKIKTTIVAVHREELVVWYAFILQNASYWEELKNNYQK